MCWPFGKRKPKPPAPHASVSLTHGVYNFGGWADPREEHGMVPGTECPNPRPWQALQTPDRNMALGQYDERLPEITETRLRWMQEGGVHFTCNQVEWAHAHARPDLLPSWRPALDPMLMRHTSENHPASSPVRFCIDNWDVMATAGDKENYWRELQERGWTAATIEDSFRAYARRVAGYMTRPNYLTVDGRPVLFYGYAHGLEFYRETFGIAPERIVLFIREEVRKHTGGDVYLVATATDPGARDNLKSWGFSALTEYLLHGDGWQNTRDVYRYWWTVDIAGCKKAGLDYIVPATCGYNSAAWGNPERFPDGRPVAHMPTAEQFAEHLREARQIAAANMTITRGMVITYAWNEIGEGGILEPMAAGQLHNGDEMLRAHRRATA